MKIRMLALSIRRSQSYFSSVYIFCQLRRKRLLSWFFDRTVWFWQPLNFASAASVCKGAKSVFGSFSYFWVGWYIKTLNDWPLGKQYVLFPSSSIFRWASPRGTLRVSRKQNSLFSLWPVIKCLLIRRRNVQCRRCQLQIDKKKKSKEWED